MTDSTEANLDRPEERLRGSQPEQQPTREREVPPEQTEAGVDSQKMPTAAETKPRDLFAFKRRPKVAIPQVRNATVVKIEKILESGVADAYARLSPVAQQEFKIKGEETAFKIDELLKSTHIKVKKIFQLILEWLRLLPGVNRFFLEQEAKIKTDRLIALHKEKK